MLHCRLLLLSVALIMGPVLAGCGSSKQELPTQEKIQQQLKRDAEMRAEEDRSEKESR